MILVRYDRGGKAYSDFEARDVARAWVKDGGPQEHVVSSDNVIFALRSLVSDGDIAPSDLVFEFEGQRIEVGSYGQLVHPVAGFCDHQRESLDHMLRNGLRRARREAD